MRGPEDCSTVTKPIDKGSCVIVWDRTNYILGAEKHVDTNAYQKVRPGYNESLKLVGDSTRMIKQLLSKKCVFPEECKYFVKDEHRVFRKEILKAVGLVETY